MKQRFVYYLHDNNDTSDRLANIRGQGVQLTSEQEANLGEPFYEVGLQCEIDETGNVTILGVKN